MASMILDMAGLDSVVARLRALGDGSDAAMRAAVRVGADVAVELMRERVPVSTRHAEHLRDHIKVMREGHDAVDGYYCEIYPDGVRPGGGKASGRRYATIGYVLEYGRSNMAPRPWMRPALMVGEYRIREAMREALEHSMEGR